MKLERQAGVIPMDGLVSEGLKLYPVVGKETFGDNTYRRCMIIYALKNVIFV